VYLKPESPWEPLASCSMMLIEQKVDMIEAMTGGLYEQKNRYNIYTNDKGLQYFVHEVISYSIK
jgi:5'-3' exonuclease